MSQTRKITLKKLTEQTKRFKHEFRRKELIEILELLVAQETTPTTVGEVKEFAKILQNYSKKLDCKIKVNHCLNIISQLYFGKDWNTVSVLANNGELEDSLVIIDLNIPYNEEYLKKSESEKRNDYIKHLTEVSSNFGSTTVIVFPPSISDEWKDKLQPLGRISNFKHELD